MINRDEWLLALSDVGVTQATMDESAVTSREFAALFSLGMSAAKERLRRLVEAGKATRVHKAVADGSGHRKIVPAYILSKPAKSKR